MLSLWQWELVRSCCSHSREQEPEWQNQGQATSAPTPEGFHPRGISIVSWGLGRWSSWWSTCHITVRTGVQIPGSHRKSHDACNLGSEMHREERTPEARWLPSLKESRNFRFSRRWYFKSQRWRAFEERHQTLVFDLHMHINTICAHSHTNIHTHKQWDISNTSPTEPLWSIQKSIWNWRGWNRM